MFYGKKRELVKVLHLILEPQQKGQQDFSLATEEPLP